MSISQTMLSIEGDGGNIHMCDTIVYKGEPWLVLSWLQMPVGELKKPERIVRLGAFPHQVLSPPHAHQYSIRSPIPKELISGGRLPEAIAGDVIDRPEISILIGHS